MGSSSSKSSSDTNYDDNRIAQQGGWANSGTISTGSGGMVSLSLSDQGAIAGALDLAGRAIDSSVVKDAMTATNYDNLLKATNAQVKALADQSAAAAEQAAAASKASAAASAGTAQAAISSNERGLNSLLDMADNFFSQSIGLVDKTISASGAAFNDAAGVINNAYAAAEAEKSGSLDQRTVIVLSVVGAVAVVAYATRKKG